MKPLIAVILGSDSDYPTMEGCFDALERFEIPYEARVLSCHRSPDLLHEYVDTFEEKGIQVIIAGAGGAAGLPGVVAALTTLPVLGVPMPTKDLGGLDSLYSTLQMPPGVPVGAMAIGSWGATNAAVFAMQILAGKNPELRERLDAYKKELIEKVHKKNERLQQKLSARNA